jgi:hypothetical protein
MDFCYILYICSWHNLIAMQSLNLPTYSLKIKSEEGLEYVFDQFRKKYVRLNPEEWVRQNFALYLVNEKAYPASRLIIEKSLKVNKMIKRCDIVVYNEFGYPSLIVECKSPGIKIGQETFEQVSIYNIAFKVEFLIITNGLKHFCCRVDFETMQVHFIDEIPDYYKIR